MAGILLRSTDATSQSHLVVSDFVHYLVTHSQQQLQGGAGNVILRKRRKRQWLLCVNGASGAGEEQPWGGRWDECRLVHSKPPKRLHVWPASQDAASRISADETLSWGAKRILRNAAVAGALIPASDEFLYLHLKDLEALPSATPFTSSWYLMLMCIKAHKLRRSVLLDVEACRKLLSTQHMIFVHSPYLESKVANRLGLQPIVQTTGTAEPLRTNVAAAKSSAATGQQHAVPGALPKTEVVQPFSQQQQQQWLLQYLLRKRQLLQQALRQVQQSMTTSQLQKQLLQQVDVLRRKGENLLPNEPYERAGKRQRVEASNPNQALLQRQQQQLLLHSKQLQQQQQVAQQQRMQQWNYWQLLWQQLQRNSALANSLVASANPVATPNVMLMQAPLHDSTAEPQANVQQHRIQLPHCSSLVKPGVVNTGTSPISSLTPLAPHLGQGLCVGASKGAGAVRGICTASGGADTGVGESAIQLGDELDQTEQLEDLGDDGTLDVFKGLQVTYPVGYGQLSELEKLVDAAMLLSKQLRGKATLDKDADSKGSSKIDDMHPLQGVSRDCRGSRHWQCRWICKGGSRASKAFSVNVFGADEAKRMAIWWRFLVLSPRQRRRVLQELVDVAVSRKASIARASWVLTHGRVRLDACTFSIPPAALKQVRITAHHHQDLHAPTAVTPTHNSSLDPLKDSVTTLAKDPRACFGRANGSVWSANGPQTIAPSEQKSQMPVEVKRADDVGAKGSTSLTGIKLAQGIHNPIPKATSDRQEIPAAILAEPRLLATGGPALFGNPTTAASIQTPTSKASTAHLGSDGFMLSKANLPQGTGMVGCDAPHAILQPLGHVPTACTPQEIQCLVVGGNARSAVCKASTVDCGSSLVARYSMYEGSATTSDDGSLRTKFEPLSNMEAKLPLGVDESILPAPCPDNITSPLSSSDLASKEQEQKQVSCEGDGTMAGLVSNRMNPMLRLNMSLVASPTHYAEELECVDAENSGNPQQCAARDCIVSIKPTEEFQGTTSNDGSSLNSTCVSLDDVGVPTTPAAQTAGFHDRNCSTRDDSEDNVHRCEDENAWASDGETSKEATVVKATPVAMAMDREAVVAQMELFQLSPGVSSVKTARPRRQSTVVQFEQDDLVKNGERQHA